MSQVRHFYHVALQPDSRLQSGAFYAFLLHVILVVALVWGLRTLGKTAPIEVSYEVQLVGEPNNVPPQKGEVGTAKTTEAPKPVPAQPKPPEPKPETPPPAAKPEPKPETPPPPKPPEPKPEPKVEPKMEPPKPQPKPEEVVPEEKPAPKPKPEPKPEVKPQPKPEPKPEPKPQPKPEPKPQAKPEPKAEPKPQPRLEPRPQARPEPGIASDRAEPTPPGVAGTAKKGFLNPAQGTGPNAVDRVGLESGLNMATDQLSRGFPTVLGRWKGLVQQKVERVWTVPAGIAVDRGDTSVDVLFTVDRQGNVIGKPALATEPKDPRLGQSVLAAIEQAAPFPPLPDEYTKSTVDLLYRFNVGRAQQGAAQ
jgi:TonB family protein